MLDLLMHVVVGSAFGIYDALKAARGEKAPA